jgi:hypothetical protein
MGIKQMLIAFFLFSLLFTHVALAQTTVNDVWNIVAWTLTQYMGLIFIIVFVIILLIIGGVWRPSMGGIFSPGLIIFVILIIVAFVFPNFITFPDYMRVVPDSFKVWELPPGAKYGLQLIGLPWEWGYVPAIIYLFILPFAAIYTLFWAFLQVLGIFPQPNVNRILALIVAFMTIPMGWFVKMVWALFSFMGAWSLAIFAAMFIGGVFFRGAGHIAKEYSAYSGFVARKKEADEFEKWARRELDQLAKERQLGSTYDQIEKQIGILSDAIRTQGYSEKSAKSEFGKMISAVKSKS